MSSGAVAATATVAGAQDDESGDRWPDDCNDVGEQDVLPVDGTQYDGTLTPNSRDAIRLALAEGEFVAVAAQFEMYDELRMGHSGDVSLTAATGEPADELEHVDTYSNRAEFAESGRYELRLYAETDTPCVELYTNDGAAGSWAMAFERGGESPPPVEAPETIEERLAQLEDRVEQLETRLEESG